jgi:ABC-type lipoprotein release transport system permease subunit
MLFFSAAEYIATARERERVVGFYQGTGAVEAAPAPKYLPSDYWKIIADKSTAKAWQYPAYGCDFSLYADPRVQYNPYGEEVRKNNYEGLSKADIDAIGKLPYVTGTSVRYMTAGVSGSLPRADDGGNYYNYTARLIAEVTLDDEKIRADKSERGAYSFHPLGCGDFTVFAGSQDCRDALRESRENGKVTAVGAFEFSPDNADDSIIYGGDMEKTVIDIHMGESYYNEIFSHDFLRSLVPGERYVIICRYTTGPRSWHSYYLTDPATTGRYPQIYPLKGLPDNYLDLDEFAPLRKLIEITNADLHTFDVVYTGDMSSIMRFAEKNMVITAGRMLTDEDSANKNNVCVMNDRYMSQNSLKIGDRISLKLGDKLFEQNAQLGAVAVVPERYADTFTEEKEFEIVGAYKDVDTKLQQATTLNWGYSVNTLFVPQSFLPVKVPDDHVVKPGEFSFVIDDPRNIKAFLAEASPIIEGKLGLTLVFTDGGWSELESQIDSAVTLAAVRLLLLCFCVAAAIILTVYLFIARKRKEYAIMRALGTPSRRANSSLYVPLAFLGIFALAAGNILGYARVGSRIEKVLAPFTQPGFRSETAVPGALVFICFICVFAALALATACMLRRIGKKPPLELLQMGTNRNAAEKSSRGPRDQIVQAGSVGRALMPVREVSKIKTPAPASGKFSAARHVGAYTARHIRRMPAKSLFSLGLALLLVGTIGQFTVIRGVYGDLYENMDVKAYIADHGITVDNAINVASSPFVNAAYCENISLSLACYREKLRVVMTNDVMRASAGAAKVEFLDGYDCSSFSKVDLVAGPANICVMDSGLMQSLSVKLGDKVRIHSTIILAMLIKDRFGIQTSVTGPDLDKMLEIFAPVLDKLSVYYTVVGRASAVPANAVYVPVTKGLTPVLYYDEALMDYVECTLASPKNAEEFGRFAKSKIEPAVGSMLSPFMMDTSEADNLLQSLYLLNTLYPIAVTAAVIMSGLFPGLIVLQSDREASIMRVLGTTKRRTRVILILEQAALCLTGQLCAAALLFAVNGSSMAAYAATLGIAAIALLSGCIAGALVCSVIVTRRRILELLQAKE